MLQPEGDSPHCCSTCSHGTSRSLTTTEQPPFIHPGIEHWTEVLCTSADLVHISASRVSSTSESHLRHHRASWREVGMSAVQELLVFRSAVPAPRGTVPSGALDTVHRAAVTASTGAPVVIAITLPQAPDTRCQTTPLQLKSLATR